MPASFKPVQPPAAPLRRALSDEPPKPPRPPWWRRVFGFVSGLGLATILLVLLGLLTWLATLEMTQSGLHTVLRRYFDWRAWYVIPQLGNEILIPLPGGYWVCAMLALNLTLGGIIRMRKGWSQAGVLIAHFGILLLFVAGAVAHHASERGYLLLEEGATNNVAEAYYEPTVEIAEIKDGKPVSIHVVRGKDFEDLTDFTIRRVKLPGLPFDLDLARYLPNAVALSAAIVPPPKDHATVSGYYLSPRQQAKDAELNLPGCLARVVTRDGKKEPPFILWAGEFHPFTVRADGRVFTVSMRKRQWVLPFALTLDRFDVEYYPGTMKPAKYASHVTRGGDNGPPVSAVIQMNEPLRREGMVFYQAKSAQTGGPGSRPASVLEVVRNPADQWPRYCLYIVTFGLLVHFGTRLVSAIRNSARSRRHDPV